jgi:hypothetical protein
MGITGIYKPTFIPLELAILKGSLFKDPIGYHYCTNGSIVLNGIVFTHSKKKGPIWIPQKVWMSRD